MNQPEAPRNQDNTTEGVRHSGEPLSNEFKAPLSDFEAMQLDNVPKDTSTMLENMPTVITTDEAATVPIATPEAKTNAEASKRKLTAKQMIGAAVAGITIVTSAIVGGKVISDNANAAPTPDVDGTTQVEEGGEESGTNTGTGTETETENEGEGTGEVENTPIVVGENDPAVNESNSEQLAESLKLSTGLTPDELGKKTIENISRWTMAGATYETWNNQDFSITPEEYAAGIAQTNTGVYKDSLFGPDADANSITNVQNYIAGMEANNARNLTFALQTFSSEEYTNSNSANTETYKLTYTPEQVSIISESENKLVLNIKFLIDSNDEKTMFGDSPAVKAEMFATYIKLGDRYVIQDIDERTR